MTSAPLPPSAERVQRALQDRGLEVQVVRFAATTRSAADAAAAIGCSVDQIAKSLVFRTKPSARAILVIACGANRVNERALAALVGEPVEKADAEFVRAQTGFAIGGVPPVGHDRPILTLIDRDLLAFAEIWAAAGTPNAVFRVSPADLVSLTGGQVVSIA